DEINKILNSDTLTYQDIEGLVESIGLPREELCLACLTNEYPTRRAQAICNKMRSSASFDKRRYWEIE
ncbi:MAG TPA: amidophosphoribosyltransferase, partial [Candidatus Bathyarchaeia archaeon]|nr:amidophosphoribosyltransferase [Candidatus Bathyarchaeia archaeon]